MKQCEAQGKTKQNEAYKCLDGRRARLAASYLWNVGLMNLPSAAERLQRTSESLRTATFSHDLSALPLRHHILYHSYINTPTPTCHLEVHLDRQEHEGGNRSTPCGF